MRAIVLCAGQGRRLLPLTQREPKCMLAVDGERSVLETQLLGLARCGVERATILVGFGAERVETFLAGHRIPGIAVDTVYNPFFAISDNLATCWLASAAMDDDFLLLNGDTVFEDELLQQVLGSTAERIVTIDQKESYDDDDMKVSLDGSRLRAIGKTLDPADVDGESIGLLAFRGDGVKSFRQALSYAIRQPDALRAWYLSVVNRLARQIPVETVNIQGLWWREIDGPDDLAEVRECYRGQAEAEAALARAGIDEERAAAR